ncbi:hypothetical protein D1641_16100 [Colidextribacter sp. OB.20]|uniref:recombinase family protein n=1 Tax=Colidextribacter sp. OB.20 TaxID=2304568 RepID=UPI00136A7EEB|nr:recombinase family protein [Colidextribacter sp. OB.20]NBI11513.1 hypothetical protein [Colidextribacter sp. OB.20]
MANRKLPFGYEMQQGIVCIKTAEAAIVKEIYAAYIRGISYRQITDSLNAQAVPYNEPGKSWNKNMVARILSNELYTGNKTYPAILSDGEYRRAVSAKPAARASFNTTAKTVRQLARCAACGSTLTLSGNKYGWARWNCPSCKAISTDAVMPDTVDVLSHILTAMVRNPELIQAPPQVEQPVQGMPEQSENEFNLAIQAEDFDEPTARAKAISLAAARFDTFGSEDYETMRIQYILARTEQNGGLDTALLRQITSAILILPTGEVSLKLKNGQIIKRSDLT